MKQQKRPHPTVLLDTNVWRDFADADAGDTLRRVARRANVTVQVAPSVVYEALRTPRAEVRDRQIALMTDPEWARLMPEAYSESQEVLGEVRRLRPEWLRRDPDIQSLRRLEHDWRRPKAGFWDRARFDTGAEAGRVRALGDPTLARARQHADSMRRIIREAGWTFDSIKLRAATRRPEFSVEGWDGDDVGPWRWAGLDTFSATLVQPRHAYIDWLSPLVDLASAQVPKAPWVRFWLYDVVALNMPRCWVRWALEVLQWLRTVTPGTPCDNQLGTYLVECDYLISADRTFVDIVRKCRDSAPFTMAMPVSVSSGGRCVSDVAQALQNIGNGRLGGNRR